MPRGITREMSRRWKKDICDLLVIAITALSKMLTPDSIVSLKRAKLRIRDECVAYRSTEADGLAEGIIIKIEVKEDSALIFVDFSHSYKTHKQREKLYKSTVHELMSMHHDNETDILALDPPPSCSKNFKRHGSWTVTTKLMVIQMR